MKKKAVEKVEMKESLLKGEALALNDAELEGAAGGAMTFEEQFAANRLNGSWTPIEDRIDTRRLRDNEIKTQPQSPTWKPITQHPDIDDKDREEIRNEVQRLKDLMNQETSRAGGLF